MRRRPRRRVDDVYPVLPRAFAALGAFAAGATLLVLQPLHLWDTGRPLTAGVMAATALPLVLFFLWFAASPATLARPLRRVSRVDLRDGGHAAALLVLAVTLYYVVGFGSLVSGAFAYEAGAGSPDEIQALGESALLSTLALNLIVLVLPVVLFVSFVHGLGPRATMRALGLRGERLPRALAAGVASAVGAILLIAIVSLALQQGGVEVPENDRALAIAQSVSLGGALAIATFAALSEEIFFRGFLQARIGLVGQAVLFSLAHLSYVNVLETVVTLVLGFAFGVLYLWTRNLWAPIAAHFAFNLIMLLVGMYAT